MAPLVIVELKRDGLCYSPVLEMLRVLRVFPHGFSKYCMGSALTNDRCVSTALNLNSSTFAKSHKACNKIIYQ